MIIGLNNKKMPCNLSFRFISVIIISLTYSEEVTKLSLGLHFTGADKILQLISESCVCKHEPVQVPVCSDTCTRPSDCTDLQGTTSKSGIYKIYSGSNSSGFNVFCDMETIGGGWTVFQRRMNGKTDFYRNWESYKRGFGNLKEEFWLGNEHIHQLTKQGNYILRIDLEDFQNNKKYAEYTNFRIGDEKSGYKLYLSGYHGDAGDSMKHENGKKFSTKDHDNDVWSKSCATQFKGGWWYGTCHNANLNGLYLKGKHTSYTDGIEWSKWKGNYYSMKRTSMMIRKV